MPPLKEKKEEKWNDYIIPKPNITKYQVKTFDITFEFYIKIILNLCRLKLSRSSGDCVTFSPIPFLYPTFK